MNDGELASPPNECDLKLPQPQENFRGRSHIRLVTCVDLVSATIDYGTDKSRAMACGNVTPFYVHEGPLGRRQHDQH